MGNNGVCFSEGLEPRTLLAAIASNTTTAGNIAVAG